MKSFFNLFYPLYALFSQVIAYAVPVQVFACVFKLYTVFRFMFLQ